MTYQQIQAYIRHMQRVSLFLKERQIKQLKALARRQELPWAFVARHAIDFYFAALRGEDGALDKELEEQPERAAETGEAYQSGSHETFATGPEAQKIAKDT